MLPDAVKGASGSAGAFPPGRAWESPGETEKQRAPQAPAGPTESGFRGTGQSNTCPLPSGEASLPSVFAGASAAPESCPAELL